MCYPLRYTFIFIWLEISSFHPLFAVGANTSASQPVALELPPSPETTVSYTCDSTNVEPTYQGLPIGQWIETKTRLNPNRLPLGKFMSMKQVSGADQWGQVGFEVPVSYDALTNDQMGGEITLGYFNRKGDFVEGCFTDSGCATNGACLVWWDTNYDPWGKHDIRAKLTFGNRLDTIMIIGPPLPFYSSNVCRFYEGYSLFDSSDATFLAKLREPTAAFRIELTTLGGKPLKVITGTTTNGLINTDWNLTDEHGRKFKGDSFYGFFYVNYPDDKTSNAPAGDRFNKIGASSPPE
jgi:hypothetical protein